MKKVSILFILLIGFVFFGVSQTNPTVQNLPVSINFGNANYAPPYTNMAAWAATGMPLSTQAAAESSSPSGDVPTGNLISGAPAGATPGGGQYGDGSGGNGRLTIQTSGNSASGTTQAALAINTTALTGINITYDLSLQVSNPRTVGVVLQYRIGTTGSFITIAGSEVSYTAGSANGGDADGNADWDIYSFPLPAAAENQPVVQLRWATWRAGSGNSAGIGIDNININTNQPPSPCDDPLAQPTILNLSSTPTTISGSFTAATPTANQYLVVRSLNSVLSTDPIDGTTYATGAALGGGTVVGSFSDPNFLDINLSPSTLYYYFIFSLNNENCTGGPNYLEANPLTASISTQALPACTTPTAATGLSLTPANNFINGTFNAAAGANRYLVVISTSTSLGTTPVNGTTYTANQSFGSGTIVSFNAATNFTATGLNTNTTYYIFVFAAAIECTGSPFYNTTPLTRNSTTTNTSTGIPTGYYNAATGLSCQPLKTALKDIISTGYVNIGYDGLWTAYQYTDLKSSGNLIWDIYTDDNNPAIPETYNFTFNSNQCGNYNSEGDCYNREHTTPKSWFNDATPMHNDIFHVMPTDGYVNGMRSNYPYGEVATATYTSTDNQSKRGTGSNYGYTGIVFQPFNAFRGDVARNALYMATRYEDQVISQNWAGNSEAAVAMLASSENGYDAARRRLQIYDDWFIKTMYKWHTEDPVSQKEIDRNNAIYYQSGQHNRNPFIDHPEYVALIWQCTGVLPVTIIDFVAQKQNEAVLLKWYATYETNFNNFEIERSIDGTNYYTIGTVRGQNLSEYSFIDNSLPVSGIVYYRLKMIDIDRSSAYSKTISVRLNNNFTNALVYPNPSSGPVKIKFTEALRSNSSLLVTDVAGRIVKQQQLNKGIFSVEMNVQELPSGRYFITINDGFQQIRQSLVVIK